MGRDHSTAIDLPRRRVLTATASGAALSTAGCTAFDADENDVDPDDTPDAVDGDDTTDADADGEPSGEAAATISVDVTEKLDAVEADPREQLEADGITETEASTRFQEAEIEIVTEAMDAIEVAVADSDGVTVADSELGRGVPLVDGEPDSLIDLLAVDDVFGLLPADDF